VFTVNEPDVGAGGYAKETEDPAGAAAMTDVESQTSATLFKPRDHPVVRFDMVKRATTDRRVGSRWKI
jgi:hypothetical protein